jgi:hypothetical protein
MPEDLESPMAEEWTLPADLLLEIIALSDTRTLVRCAATSRLLRRDILDPSFIHRVTRREAGGIVPQRFLASINTHDDTNPGPALLPLSLVQPVTAAAVSFVDEHMSPYMSRFADDLLGERIPVTSRGGLVLLRRRYASEKLSSLCVYDPFTGHRTFFSDPPGIGTCTNSSRRYHLLTSSDGIGCSFLLLAANLDGRAGTDRHTIQVQTIRSTCGIWAPSAMVHDATGFIKQEMNRDAVILDGGVMHWLVQSRREILTYNIYTMEVGAVQLPVISPDFKGRLYYLGSYYSDGRKLLRLMSCNVFKIYMWHQLLDGGWAPEPVTIDMEEKLLSLDPAIIEDGEVVVRTELKWLGEGSEMVELRIYRRGSNLSRGVVFIVLDMETKEMHVHQNSTPSSVLLEVDLPSQLRAMKLFP